MSKQYRLEDGSTDIIMGNLADKEGSIRSGVPSLITDSRHKRQAIRPSLHTLRLITVNDSRPHGTTAPILGLNHHRLVDNNET